MRLFFKLLIFVIYIAISQQSIYNILRDNLLSFIEKENKVEEEPKVSGNEFKDAKQESVLNVINDNILRFIQKSFELSKSKNVDTKSDDLSSNFIAANEHYKNPKNYMKKKVNRNAHSKSRPKSKHAKPDSFRRSKNKKHDKVSSVSSSSSLELKDWKDEWREHWMKKKLEAINSSRPRGDVVNMVAARPWGVPCGDPNQHDMPWGTCMLARECDAEYRIYRGDYFCGRTQFVCCALELNTYDMYQGFDVSFADSRLSTDSQERRERDKTSSEKRGTKQRQERRKRQRERRKRKRKMSETINKIIREMRKILQKTYRNGTKQRKRKTKQMKKFIKELKRKYRKDRQSAKTIHENTLIKIDAALQNKFNDMTNLHHDFLKNATFKDIVVNGTISKKEATMLLQAYPELSDYLEARRAGDLEVPKDYLEYDVEYGLLYH